MPEIDSILPVPGARLAAGESADPPAAVLGWAVPLEQDVQGLGPVVGLTTIEPAAGGLARPGGRGWAWVPRLRYPWQFKALVLTVLMLSTFWIGNYFGQVVPSIDKYVRSNCSEDGTQLSFNARMLFVYYMWFLVSRFTLFVPCVIARVILLSRASGANTCLHFCRTYCVHLVMRDGPLYIFAFASLLFWLNLMQAPACDLDGRELYASLRGYAIYSNVVSTVCLAMAYWHGKLIADAVRALEAQPPDRGAPPGTMLKLETRCYDAACFGDEEGKRFPADCPICLSAWEAQDVIKVTPCEHAFHEECLAGWFRTARTCAICRRDLAPEADAGQTIVAMPPRGGIWFIAPPPSDPARGAPNGAVARAAGAMPQLEEF